MEYVTLIRYSGHWEEENLYLPRKEAERQKREWNSKKGDFEATIFPDDYLNPACRKG